MRRHRRQNQISSKFIFFLKKGYFMPSYCGDSRSLHPCRTTTNNKDILGLFCRIGSLFPFSPKLGVYRTCNWNRFTCSHTHHYIIEATTTCNAHPDFLEFPFCGFSGEVRICQMCSAHSYKICFSFVYDLVS